jgi:hypothetical protein
MTTITTDYVQRSAPMTGRLEKGESMRHDRGCEAAQDAVQKPTPVLDGRDMRQPDG